MDGPVLAFDTSGPHCAVAVVRGDEVLAQRVEAMTKDQAERLMPLIAEILAEAGVAREDLVAIGVGTGPGNFTGTRIAVAAARGLALGLGIPAEGVSSIEAYAAERDAMIVCLPAPRGQVIIGRGEDIRISSPEAPLPAGWTGDLTGPAARDMAEETGRSVQATPEIAPAIARLAARRAGPGRARPAPVYLRPADAAPASDLPPTIL